MIYELCDSKVGKRLIERKVKVVRGEGNFVHHQTLTTTNVQHYKMLDTTNVHYHKMLSTDAHRQMLITTNVLSLVDRRTLLDAIHWRAFVA